MLAPEQLQPRVNAAYIDQHSRVQPYAVESGPILAHGNIRARTADDVFVGVVAGEVCGFVLEIVERDDRR